MYNSERSTPSSELSTDFLAGICPFLGTTAFSETFNVQTKQNNDATMIPCRLLPALRTASAVRPRFTSTFTSTAPAIHPSTASDPTPSASDHTPSASDRTSSTAADGTPSTAAAPHGHRIVTSFLTTAYTAPSAPDPAAQLQHPTHVLLLRRAAHAPRLPNLWAAVSGAIEATDATALAAARREIREETALGPERLRLLHASAPRRIADHEARDVGQHWEVHVFVWQVGAKGRAAVRLDEWHAERAWVPIDEIDGWRTPDGLGQALFQCLRDMKVEALAGDSRREQSRQQWTQKHLPEQEDPPEEKDLPEQKDPPEQKHLPGQKHQPEQKHQPAERERWTAAPWVRPTREGDQGAQPRKGDGKGSERLKFRTVEPKAKKGATELKIRFHVVSTPTE